MSTLCVLNDDTLHGLDIWSKLCLFECNWEDFDNFTPISLLLYHTTTTILLIPEILFTMFVSKADTSSCSTMAGFICELKVHFHSLQILYANLSADSNFNSMPQHRGVRY